MSSSNPEPLVVLCTAPDEAKASSIAEKLVTERLAACVNIVESVKSIYIWDGSLQRDTECLMVIKSDRAVINRLKERILGLHPYDTPEVIALPIEDGVEAYLSWLAESIDRDN